MSKQAGDSRATLTLLPHWLVRDMERGSRPLREPPCKGELEPFLSLGTPLGAGLRLEPPGWRRPWNSRLKHPLNLLGGQEPF